MHDLTASPPAEAVHAATARRWDLEGLPTPTAGWLSCPVCGDSRPLIRWWRFHRRPKQSTTPWRCDVSFKCTDCAAVWLHGVVLDKATWDARPAPARDKRTIMRREAVAKGWLT